MNIASLSVDGLGKAKTTYQESQRHWAQFLLASNGVFTALEQGSKSSGTSRAWFGRQKNVRRTDDLLSYLQHARNAYEHGLPSITMLEPPKLSMMAGEDVVGEIRNFNGRAGRYHPVGSSDPSTVTEMRIYPERAALVAVRDRGVEYLPPTRHLESPLLDNSPVIVASLALKFLEEMIKEARQL
jgi:hypothetical protein